MKIGDKLYFSPNYTFAELDLAKPDLMTKAFADRVGGFYLKPARVLVDAKDAFAAGLLCAACIDFLSTYDWTVREIAEKNNLKRIPLWLEKYVPEFRQAHPVPAEGWRGNSLAWCFYDDFRNGLVHNGCIRNLGQFSLEGKEIVRADSVGKSAVMSVDVGLLLAAIEKAFGSFFSEVIADPQKQAKLTEQLAGFAEEIALAKSP